MTLETWKSILSIFSGFTIIAVAISWVAKGFRKVKEPNEMQDKQIKENAEKIEDHEARLAKQEKQGNLLMQGMLALLSHSIDGNNIDGMKTAKSDIQKFLIEK